LAFDPTGTSLLSGSEDHSIRVWELDRQHEPARIVHGRGEINRVGVSPDGRMLGFGTRSGDAVVHDLRSSATRFRRHIEQTFVWGVAFHPRRPLVTFGFRELPPEQSAAGRIASYRLSDGSAVGDVPDVRGQCSDVAYAADGKWLAATYLDHSNPPVPVRLQVWDTKTWRDWTFAPRGGTALNGCAFSPDSTRVASVGDDRRVRVFDVASGKLLIESPPMSAPLVSVAYSPSGDRLAVGNWPRDEFGDRLTEVCLLDAETLRVTQTLLGHQSGVCGLGFSPDGGVLASGAGGGQVKLWDTESGAELATLQTPATGWVIAVRFSPNGESLFASYGSEDDECGVIRFDASDRSEIEAHHRRSRDFREPPNEDQSIRLADQPMTS